MAMFVKSDTDAKSNPPQQRTYRYLDSYLQWPFSIKSATIHAFNVTWNLKVCPYKTEHQLPTAWQ